jgi:YesN/AraC family two-component response regulator
MFKIVIADDMPEYLVWLQALFEGSGEFRVVGTAGTGRETLELVDREGPDLLIADVEMSDLNGLQVARRIRRDWPKTSVILISNFDSPTYQRLAIEVGALAFIPKTGLTLETLQEAWQRETSR